MKRNQHLALLMVLFLFLLGSCQQQKEVKDQMDPATTLCYTAVDGVDTAWLNIDTAHHQVIGLLKFNYNNKKRYEGEFKGTINGDTLKGHYDFKVNNMEKWYRNPVAFLKKDGKLTMGVGDMVLIWGSAYFDDKKVIDYDKGRFVFEQGVCQVK